MKDLSQLVLRGTAGTLLAGHGGQKLFGWFGGPGPEGTRGMMETLNLKPAERWAFVGGASEFGGGVLTALGLFHPVGPLGIIGAMAMAARKVHWNKPIWATEGGAELPLTNMAIALALMLSGPDRYSLDRLFGIRLPGWVGPVGLVVALAIVAKAVQESEREIQEEGE